MATTTASPEIDQLRKALVGKPYKEANACLPAGYETVRAVKINGASCMVTRDFRLDRANVSVVDGIISDVTGVG